MCAAAVAFLLCGYWIQSHYVSAWNMTWLRSSPLMLWASVGATIFVLTQLNAFSHTTRAAEMAPPADDNVPPNPLAVLAHDIPRCFATSALRIRHFNGLASRFGLPTNFAMTLLDQNGNTRPLANEIAIVNTLRCRTLKKRR